MSEHTEALLLGQIEELAAKVDQLLERTPDTKKIWLDPAELASIVGKSTRTITKWRVDGKFSDNSWRVSDSGRHQYHRLYALADLKQEVG